MYMDVGIRAWGGRVWGTFFPAVPSPYVACSKSWYIAALPLPVLENLRARR